MVKIKVFDYIPELDCFKPSAKYTAVVGKLGLSEWNPVVWIGRYFALDNDYGEHWFDNHELREKEEFRARAIRLGYDPDELLIIDPVRFLDKTDGPCHSDELRKKFWTDVLCSLHLSLDTIIEQAKFINERDNEKFK